MKLKEILKAQQGWTDEQIAAAISDPATLKILDDLFGTVTSERDSLKARDAEWERKLNEEFNPAIAKAEQQAAEARMRAAQYEEQVKIAKDYGYLAGEEAERRAAEAAAAAAARMNPAGEGGYDPKRHPTWEDVNKFADAEGEAIALSNDLAAEYAYLTGKTLFDYETTINGQQMRGMRALRAEAKMARKPLDQYVAEKCNFAGLRQQKRDEAQKAHDDAIRKEATEAARREMAEKYGNPNMAMPMPSRAPFMPQKQNNQHPWERGTQQERRANRVNHLMQTQVASGQVQ